MRLAVFSDVHGNLTALEAVLADIAKQSVDKSLFAGDFCLFGPRPAACLDLIRDFDCTAVYGNTDDWLLGRQAPPEHMADLAAWTHDQLDEEQRAWLDAIPFSEIISPAADQRDALLIVHANPQDVNQLIFPPEKQQIARYGRIRQPDKDLEEILQDTIYKNIVFGHLHIPFLRPWNDMNLFNISSVSLPGDGDPRAKYGLFTWDSDGWTFERKFVPYHAAPERDAYQANKPPSWQNFIQTIDDEGIISQKV